MSIISFFPLTIDLYVYSTKRLAAVRWFSQDTPFPPPIKLTVTI